MTRMDCPTAIFVKPGDNVARVLADITPECGGYVELCQVFGGWHLLVKPERVKDYEQYCDMKRYRSLEELLEELARRRVNP